MSSCSLPAIVSFIICLPWLWSFTDYLPDSDDVAGSLEPLKLRSDVSDRSLNGIGLEVRSRRRDNECIAGKLEDCLVASSQASADMVLFVPLGAALPVVVTKMIKAGHAVTIVVGKSSQGVFQQGSTVPLDTIATEHHMPRGAHMNITFEVIPGRQTFTVTATDPKVRSGIFVREIAVPNDFVRRNHPEHAGLMLPSESNSATVQSSAEFLVAVALGQELPFLASVVAVALALVWAKSSLGQPRPRQLAEPAPHSAASPSARPPGAMQASERASELEVADRNLKLIREELHFERERNAEQRREIAKLRVALEKEENECKRLTERVAVVAPPPPESTLLGRSEMPQALFNRPDIKAGAQPTAASSQQVPRLDMTFASAPEGGFASPYEADPVKNSAFLIPGDEELFVGGGALNGAVGKFLLEHGRQLIAFERQNGSYVMVKDAATGKEVPKFNKTACVYRKTHEAMFHKAFLRPNKLVFSDARDIGTAPLALSAARVYSDCDKPFGAAFLDMFRAETRPKSTKNVALLYTVGALGRNKKAEGEGIADEARAKYVKSNVQDFLQEIFMTGRNVAQLVVDYNAERNPSDPSQPAVEIIRLPIVSGGVFINPATTPKEVALALLWGVSAALMGLDPRARPEVELMPGKDMQDAYDLYRKGARPSQWNSPEGKYIFAKIPQEEQVPKYTASGRLRPARPERQPFGGTASLSGASAFAR